MKCHHFDFFQSNQDLLYCQGPVRVKFYLFYMYSGVRVIWENRAQITQYMCRDTQKVIHIRKLQILALTETLLEFQGHLGVTLNLFRVFGGINETFMKLGTSALFFIDLSIFIVLTYGKLKFAIQNGNNGLYWSVGSRDIAKYLLQNQSWKPKNGRFCSHIFEVLYRENLPKKHPFFKL